MFYDEDDREFYSLHELFGSSSDIYPVVYALKICDYKDFHFAVVREAFYIGVSVENDLPTHEVVFIDEDGGEILTEYDGALPYNSLPSIGVFSNYDSAREACEELNNDLIKQYSDTHFDFEVDNAWKAIQKAYEEEDKFVYKDINRDVKNPSMFSTVYIKTKYPN